jgi:PBP1b-binding outer membrane lipoprotein LpoB
MRFKPLYVLLLCSVLASGCAKTATTAESTSAQTVQSGKVEQELEQRLKTIPDGAQGRVSLALIHI